MGPGGEARARTAALRFSSVGSERILEEAGEGGGYGDFLATLKGTARLFFDRGDGVRRSYQMTFA